MEAIMYAGIKKLNNLLCNLTITNIKMKALHTLGDIRFKDKLNFGWNFISIDGHSLEEILNALNTFKLSELPTFIDANTIKGRV